MAAPKERHYWSQLRAALTAGQWRSPTPGRTPKGAPLSWAELIRKFNKHCKGYEDVSQAASQTQFLALLLCAEKADEDEDDISLDEPPLGLGQECLLPEERLDEAKAAYDALRNIESSFDTINLALAYFAYALGNPSDCVQHLKKVPELLQFHNHIPTGGSTRSEALTVPPSTYSSASFAGSFTSIIDTTVAEVRDGRGWAMAETFRSLCLQGMCYERLEPSNPHRALEAYADALPLFNSLISEFASKSLPQPATGGVDFAAFTQLRELWRWVERLLWRAIILNAQTAHIHSSPTDSEETKNEAEDTRSHQHRHHQLNAAESLWTWFRHYSVCSRYWPSNFRTSHRSTISSLYIRALVIRHGTIDASSSLPASPSSPSQTETHAPSWLAEARSVIQDYRAILNASTQFPAAGRQNIKVEEFVDLCVATWEAAGAHGEQAGWVIDILWWATRLTFNSSRVLRHMTRLLHLSGDTPLAKRTLRLYIQVVSKAYEASKEGVGEDKDTDAYWVETLVFGARMLCRCAAILPGLAGIEDVQEAVKVLEKARLRLDPLDKSLVAKVELAEGIADLLLANKGHDPLTRSHYLLTAHEHLLRSVWEDKTSAGCYHLAVSFASRGQSYDPDKAVEFAGAAVEMNPQDIRCWHLLGILLTKQEKWKEAREILEHGAVLDGMDDHLDGPANAGAEEGDDGEDVDDEEEDKVEGGTVTQGDTLTVNGSETKPGVRGVNGNGNGHPNHRRKDSTASRRSVVPAHPHTHILSLDAAELPRAATLLRPELWSIYPPSKQELVEYHLQLRMTQALVTEIIEGPEGAEVQWVDIYSWVAEKKVAAPVSGTAEGNGNLDTPRRSMDGSRRSMSQLNLNSTSDGYLGVERRPSSSSRRNLTSASAMQLPPPVSLSQTMPPNSPPDSPTHLEAPVTIPIMISPATPDVEATQVDASSTLEIEKDGEKEKEKSKDKEKKDLLSGLRKRSTSIDQDNRDTSKSKKVGKMLINHVHKGRAGITAVSKRIGHGVTKNGVLRRSTSTPDFHAVLQHTSYQASSIHSRRRLSSVIQSRDRTPHGSPPPPPPIPSPSPTPNYQDFKLRNNRSSRQNRLLSELWLMSAATFRRLSKIEQVKGAIQEAEVKDESNPNVWVQLGLYYIALGLHQHAMDAFQKALFISPEDPAATVHLARLYLHPELDLKTNSSPTAPSLPSDYHKNLGTNPRAASPSVDLAAGMLAYLTKGVGWDIAEAWYYLAKAYGLQGQKAKEKETLAHALQLAERRGVRDIGLALGWCA